MRLELIRALLPLIALRENQPSSKKKGRTNRPHDVEKNPPRTPRTHHATALSHDCPSRIRPRRVILPAGKHPRQVAARMAGRRSARKLAILHARSSPSRRWLRQAREGRSPPSRRGRRPALLPVSSWSSHAVASPSHGDAATADWVCQPHSTHER
jgi:hypothetical protein